MKQGTQGEPDHLSVTFTRSLLTLAALSAVTLAGASPAMAATTHGKPAPKHSPTHVGKKTTKKAAKRKPTAKPTSVPTVSAPARVTEAVLSPYEARLLTDVNGARAAAGVAALRAVPGLTDVARRWTLQLVHDDQLSHNPDLVKDLTASGAQAWHAIEENVGMASGTDADDVFGAYMASPLHKANILNPKVRWIGIGAVDATDSYGSVTWDTLDFSDSYDPSYGASRTGTVTGLLDATGVSGLAASWGVRLS